MLTLVNDFKKISETGRSIIILIATSTCDCFNPEDLSNSEPSPICTKCYGTGKKRLKIKTAPVRFQIYNDANNIFEDLDKNITEYNDEKMMFFLPSVYKNITNEELIVVLKEGVDTDIAEKIYKIVNIIPFVNESFIFFEAYGEKINIAPEVII